MSSKGNVMAGQSARAPIHLHHGRGPAAWAVRRRSCFTPRAGSSGAFDVNTDGLATLQQELGSDNCLIGRLDVTKKDEFDSTVATFAIETDGKMDMLFSNAGIGESGWFEDIPFEAAMRVVNVNFVGVLASIYASLPLLKATKNAMVFHHLVVLRHLWHAAHRRLFGDQARREGAHRGALGGVSRASACAWPTCLPGLIDTAILRATPKPLR